MRKAVLSTERYSSSKKTAYPLSISGTARPCAWRAPAILRSSTTPCTSIPWSQQSRAVLDTYTTYPAHHQHPPDRKIERSTTDRLAVPARVGGAVHMALSPNPQVHEALPSPTDSGPSTEGCVRRQGTPDGVPAPNPSNTRPRSGRETDPPIWAERTPMGSLSSHTAVAGGREGGAYGQEGSTGYRPHRPHRPVGMGASGAHSPPSPSHG